jgi:hypothetical protein
MELVITADERDYADTIGFWLLVGVPGGDFLIFDPDWTPNSGPTIRATLEGLGYEGTYMTDLSQIRDYLFNFNAVFVCVGMYPQDYIIPEESPSAESLVSYIVNHGGNLYMEGGDLWYFHPLTGGYEFAPHFGIDPRGDGTADLTHPLGQTGTFTEGMSFEYGGENNYVDHIEPISPAVKIFDNPSDGQGCGVAYDAGTYKTVGLSFELGGLLDGTEPSTKAALLDSIMSFFGLNPDVEEGPGRVFAGTGRHVHLAPTLTSGVSTLELSVEERTHASVRLFDASGRPIRTVFSGALPPPGRTLEIQTGGLPEGIYFVEVRLGTKRFTRKLLKIEN